MRQSYAGYYADCRRSWSDGADAAPVYRLGVRTMNPARPHARDLMTLPAAYGPIVARLARSSALRLDSGEGRFVNPDPAARRLAIQLDDFVGLDGLEELADLLVPELEARVFRCWAFVNQVSVIRSVAAGAKPVSSWLWHYDNCAAETCKLLIYLTDVAEPGRGAFEYLAGPEPGRGMRVATSRLVPGDKGHPVWPGSRIPEQRVRQWLDDGWEARPVLGPRGTMVVFDANCVHRATIPCSGHRDAIIFSLRPCEQPVRPAVSPMHTGSWTFNAKDWDPRILAPREARGNAAPKPAMQLAGVSA